MLPPEDEAKTVTIHHRRGHAAGRLAGLWSKTNILGLQNRGQSQVREVSKFWVCPSNGLRPGPSLAHLSSLAAQLSGRPRCGGRHARGSEGAWARAMARNLGHSRRDVHRRDVAESHAKQLRIRGVQQIGPLLGTRNLLASLLNPPFASLRDETVRPSHCV